MTWHHWAMSLSDDSIITQATDILGAEIDADLVLLTADFSYVGLDPVAKRVWELLAEPRTLVQLVAMLTDEFDVDRTECRRDITPFLVDLAEHELIVVQ